MDYDLFFKKKTNVHRLLSFEICIYKNGHIPPGSWLVCGCVSHGWAGLHYSSDFCTSEGFTKVLYAPFPSYQIQTAEKTQRGLLGPARSPFFNTILCKMIWLCPFPQQLCAPPSASRKKDAWWHLAVIFCWIIWKRHKSRNGSIG